MNGSPKRVFIGGSQKFIFFVKALENHFQDSDDNMIEITPWWEWFKEGGKTTFDKLLKTPKHFHAAVFFFTEDIESSVKDKFYATPNVWFELGLFISSLKIENVILAMESQCQIDERVIKISDFRGFDFFSFKWPNSLSYLNSMEMIENIFNQTADGKKLTNDNKDIYSNDNVYCNRFKDEKKKKLINDYITELNQLAIQAVEQIACKIRKVLLENDEKPSPKYFLLEKRDEVYQVAEGMIKSAPYDTDSIVYTMLAYENEEDSLNEVISSRLQEHIKHYLSEKNLSFDTLLPEQMRDLEVYFKTRYKRYVNLGYTKCADFAKKILNLHPNIIEIKDTHCSIIEVVIVKNKVLLTWPRQGLDQVGSGIVITDPNFYRRMKHWFENHVPEKNLVSFESAEDIDTYRNTLWEFPKGRNEDHPCYLCAPPKNVCRINDENLRNKNHQFIKFTTGKPLV